MEGQPREAAGGEVAACGAVALDVVGGWDMGSSSMVRPVAGTRNGVSRTRRVGVVAGAHANGGTRRVGGATIIFLRSLFRHASAFGIHLADERTGVGRLV